MMKRLRDWFRCRKADKAVEAQATGDWAATQMKAQVKSLGSEVKARSKEAVKESRRARLTTMEVHEMLHEVLKRVKPAENDNAAP